MKSTKLPWKVDGEDFLKIERIVDRIEEVSSEDKTFDRMDYLMDLIAVHLNEGPLDLDKMLTVTRPTLAHDVFGIRKFLDRKTGKLTNNFIPRCLLSNKDAPEECRHCGEQVPKDSLYRGCCSAQCARYVYN